MPRRPSLPVPLYGGMRVPPPRTKTEAIVFAVMANPEVLRMSGKNAQDPKVNNILPSIELFYRIIYKIIKFIKFLLRLYLIINS